MTKILIGVLLASGSAALIGASNDWSIVASKLALATVFVESDEGTCTGFVINSAARKGETDFILTAAHCDGPHMFADHVPARVVFKDTKKDLLVLEVENLERPALRLAKDDPKVGDQVASYGYGMGLERPMFRTASISDTATYIPEAGIGGPFIQTDAQFIGGQSGGPVVNLTGEVVLIVQRGGSGLGIGVGANIIRVSVARFFEK